MNCLKDEIEAVMNIMKTDSSNLVEDETEKKSTRLKEIDISDPRFKVPFQYGWKREVVHRRVSKHNNKQSDVYYFGPDNKKFRSRAEIVKSS